MSILENRPQQQVGDNYQQQPEEPMQDYQYSQGQDLQELMSAVHIFRLENTQLIDEIKKELKGFEKDSVGKWSKKHTEWANDEGVSKIISILRSCGLNKNINLGFLTEDEVYDRVRLIWQKLAYMLCVNYHRYGVRKSHRTMIIQILIQQVHSALSRSLYGKEAKQISSMSQHVEQIVKHERPKSSFFNPAKMLSRRER